MPRLSHFLTSALNQSAINPSRVDHLIDRWELALCDIGETRGWFDADDTVYLSQRRGTAHVDDTVSCDNCCNSELVQYSYGIQTRNAYGRTIEALYCESCRDDETFFCGNCNATWSNDCAENVDDEYYCTECASEIESNSDDVPSYHSASRPRCPFDKTTERIYSLELELESSDRSGLVCSLSDRNLERVIWERDGSLDEENGLEVIFCYQRDVDKLNQLVGSVVDLAVKHASRSWSTNRCGIHINSNRCKVWTPSAVMRLLWLVKRHSETLKAISGRSVHYASWDRLPKLMDWQNGYCDKYTCVRVGRDRLEWRMFKGTLNKARIDCYLQTVKLLEDFALSKNIGELMRSNEIIKNRLITLANAANSEGAKIKL